ncbi:transposase-like zinc-binding domain-containing protein [Bifidobacterium actinocoloniiforme]
MVRRKSARARLCPVCARPMRKKGRTALGSQRWKCGPCSAP